MQPRERKVLRPRGSPRMESVKETLKVRTEPQERVEPQKTTPGRSLNFLKETAHGDKTPCCSQADRLRRETSAPVF